MSDLVHTFLAVAALSVATLAMTTRPLIETFQPQPCPENVYVATSDGYYCQEALA